MNSKITFLIASIFLVNIAVADTSDYIWNEQFSKRIVEAKAGKTRSQYDVGNMYLKGQGTHVNEAKAFKWFMKAAKNKHTKSQFKIGFMLLNGTGTKRNYTQAEKWLRKAANKNNAPAQYYLAGMYRDGRSLDKDYDRSLFWLKKAKENGFWKAANEYDKMVVLARESNANRARAAKLGPQVVQKPRPRVTSSDLRDILLQGKWFERGKPARYLPSALVACKKNKNGLACASRQDLNGSRGNTTFKYRIAAILKNISQAGDFTVTYRNTIKSVVQGRPQIILGDDDDEESTIIVPSPTVKTGLQRTVHNLDCHLVNPKQINCVRDRGRPVKLTR